MQLKDYINNQIKKGGCSFSLAVAEKELGKSNVALRSAIAHLIAKGELVSPARGFYVIVPPEYQILKSLPAEHFIPYLMDYWGINYYAALLTAARYHGSTHQSSQVFQVIVPKHKPEIICGKVRIKFYANKNMINTPTQKISTAKSRLIISTPEGTAMDLMHYINQSGGLSHIATILSELQESISPEKLLLLAENQKSLPWKQRLGYILEATGSVELAEILKSHLKKHKKIDFIPLMPGIETYGVRKNKTWKILENTTIEGDDI
jgi:predicted transcriptional regulator of viral defense system